MAMDELFVCDKPNYDYEAIKIQCEADRKKREFNLKNMGCEDPGKHF